MATPGWFSNLVSKYFHNQLTFVCEGGMCPKVVWPGHTWVYPVCCGASRLIPTVESSRRGSKLLPLPARRICCDALLRASFGCCFRQLRYSLSSTCLSLPGSSRLIGLLSLWSPNVPNLQCCELKGRVNVLLTSENIGKLRDSVECMLRRATD